MSTPYPKEPISPLRARMIDDMRIRNFSLATQRGYIRDLNMLAACLGRSPDTATAEDLRTFQRHLAATCGKTTAALTFRDSVLGRPLAEQARVAVYRAPEPSLAGSRGSRPCRATIAPPEHDPTDAKPMIATATTSVARCSAGQGHRPANTAGITA